MNHSLPFRNVHFLFFPVCTLHRFYFLHKLNFLHLFEFWHFIFRKSAQLPTHTQIASVNICKRHTRVKHDTSNELNNFELVYCINCKCVFALFYNTKLNWEKKRQFVSVLSSCVCMCEKHIHRCSIKSINRNAVFSLFLFAVSLSRQLLSLCWHHLCHRSRIYLFSIYFSSILYSLSHQKSNVQQHRMVTIRRKKIYGCKVVWLLTSYLTNIDAWFME